LDESREKHDATIQACCVVPDHLHVLVEVPEGKSLKTFVRLFEQLSGYRLKQAVGDFAWQTSYYDRVLRTDQAIVDVAEYIWENPLKEGLAAAWEKYPFSGPREAFSQVQRTCSYV
jgi:REP element-mobilizing transposase RayT